MLLPTLFISHFLVQDLDEFVTGTPTGRSPGSDVRLPRGTCENAASATASAAPLKRPEPRAAGRVGLVLLPPAWKSNGEHGFVDGVRVASDFHAAFHRRSAGRVLGWRFTPRPCRGRRGSHRRLLLGVGAAGRGVGFFAKGPNAAATLATTAHERAASLFALCRCRDYALLRWSALAVFDPREPYSRWRHCLACVLRLSDSGGQARGKPADSRAVQSSGWRRDRVQCAASRLPRHLEDERPGELRSCGVSHVVGARRLRRESAPLRAGHAPAPEAAQRHVDAAVPGAVATVAAPPAASRAARPSRSRCRCWSRRTRRRSRCAGRRTR